MRLGPYELLPETFYSLSLNLIDSWRTILAGWPRLGDEPAEIAKASLRANARDVLWAGSGHFRFMWIADFGKTLRGAWDVLGPEYLGRQIDRMTEESARLGYVPSCFSPRRGFDMPWPRGDGLPWLVFAHAVRTEKTGRGPSDAARAALQRLLDAYERTHFENGLIATHVTGDWVDTVRRPSSTYNNLCALYLLRAAPGLGLETRHDPVATEALLLERRWKNGFFTDCHANDVPSADAPVACLYLGLGPSGVREACARWLESSGLLDPIPMRCSAGRSEAHVPLLTRLAGGYHLSVWLHLGLMALNGLKRQGRDVSSKLAAIDAVIRRHGQVVEAIDPSGAPYKSPFISCERGLSMAAGQYLEAVG
jgi:hypothetical protein